MLSIHASPIAPLGGWETGGMNVYVHALSRALGETGVEVDVFTRRQDASLPTTLDLGHGARLIQLDAGPPKYIDKYAVLDYLPDLACNLQRFRNFSGRRYDVIHAHYWLSGRLGLLFKDRWRAPLVSTFHTLGRMKNHVAQDEAEREEIARIDIERRIMAQSDRIIASTPLDREQMIKHYGASGGSISIIPPGVDLDLFRPLRRAPARATLGLDDRPVILFVGRIQRLKGIDMLLRALGTIKSAAPGLRPTAVIVGGSAEGTQVTAEREEMGRLLQLASSLEVSEQVRFVGGVPQEELPAYYAAADVTVMPSTYESFGLVALESMACGTPVVAARVGGLATLVRDNETGYLVPWRDPALFGEKIQLLLTNPALRRRMGRNARGHALRFGWQASADSILGVYERVRAPWHAAEPAHS
jgi:D-inositol-3-phosphate glycosyltransferase